MARSFLAVLLQQATTSVQARTGGGRQRPTGRLLTIHTRFQDQELSRMMQKIMLTTRAKQPVWGSPVQKAAPATSSVTPQRK